MTLLKIARMGHPVLLKTAEAIADPTSRDVGRLLEDMVDIALAECERFYPALQFVVWAGHTPCDAIASAMMDTVGEA